MKFSLIALVLLFTSCGNSPEIKSNIPDALESDTTLIIEPETAYNVELAKEYGADEYGMKPYVMAFLKTGPNTPRDSIHAVELQSAHMANIGRLAKEGKLVLAGPFYGEAKGEFRGIYIFNTDNLDSAKAYTASDPAIQFESLKMELINFYGSAALMGVQEAHSKIKKVDP